MDKIKKDVTFVVIYSLYIVNVQKGHAYMVFQKCVLDKTRKRNREIMHKDKKDSELIEEYYNTYEQKIFRLSNVILGDKWQAEEAVQETFLRIIRHRDTVRRMSEEKRAAYITRIAKSIAIDMYRKNKKATEKVCAFSGDSESADVFENMIWQGGGSVGQSDMTETVENRQILDAVMGKLSDDDALVIRFRAEQQLSVRETAAIMNMSESAVRKKYERAVSRAHKLLVKEMMLYGE